MLPQKSGRIINMSSVGDKLGKPVLGVYVAAKHAIDGLTKSMAQGGRHRGHHRQRAVPGLVINDTVKENGPRTAEAVA